MKEPIWNMRAVCPTCLPPPPDLSNLTVGHFVKTIDNYERFWVKVAELHPDGMIVGVVDNDLVLEHSFVCGDVITIHRDKVIEVWV
jgi:hypothetical protein